MTSDVKKLSSYCLNVVQTIGRVNGFNSLKSNKNNKIIITNDNFFKADDKKINDIMMSYALNRDIMVLLYGSLFLEGQRGKYSYYSPLLYTGAKLVRNGDTIELRHDNDFIININLIASLLGKDEDIIEQIMEHLLNIEMPDKIDFKAVLKGLFPDIKGLKITDKKAIILTTMPESTAGLISELKRIISEY